MAGEDFGASISLSSNGSRVAIGGRRDFVCVYEYSGSDWVLLGDTLFGQPQTRFGSCAEISSDGNTLAVGSPYSDLPNLTNCGAVFIYDWDGTYWVARGNPVYGVSSFAYFGEVIELHQDNNTWIASAPFAGGGFGSIRRFSWISGMWQEVGIALSAGPTIERFGASTSMSDTGEYLVAHGVTNGLGISIRTFQWNGFSYVPDLAELVFPDLIYVDGSGGNVVLSGDGNSLLVRTTARVELFHRTPEMWNSICTWPETSFSESISFDGTHVVLGFPTSLGSLGQIKIMRLIDIQFVQIGSHAGTNAVDHFGGVVTMSSNPIRYAGAALGQWALNQPTDIPGYCRFLEFQYIGGCIDPKACNYSALANEDNGRCVFPPYFRRLSSRSRSLWTRNLLEYRNTAMRNGSST